MVATSSRTQHNTMSTLTVNMSSLTAADLGYGEAPSAADLGYGEAPSAADLGYGEAPSAADLGYDESSPPASIDLSYAETTTYSESMSSDHGSDTETIATPSGEVEALPARRLLRRMGRRCSLGGGCYTPNASLAPNQDDRVLQPRRASMFHVPHPPRPTQQYQPSHHGRAPRRSSMAATISTTHQQVHKKAPRRVSFGGSPCVSHVEKLHSTEEEKTNMWYNVEELNSFRRTIRAIVQHKEELDETQDCWRGLETYIRDHRTRSVVSSSKINEAVLTDSQMRNQIILQLAALEREQRQLESENSDDSGVGADDDDEQKGSTSMMQTLLQRQTRNLQSSAQILLRRSTRTGKAQAAQDAAEAQAIYMEAAMAYVSQQKEQRE